MKISMHWPHGFFTALTWLCEVLQYFIYFWLLVAFGSGIAWWIIQKSKEKAMEAAQQMNDKTHDFAAKMNDKTVLVDGQTTAPHETKRL